MCGIAGFVSPAASAFSGPEQAREATATLDARVLDAMIRSLAHRGPDGSGHHLAPGVALGHRRLAIVDLAGGAQPMSDLGGDSDKTDGVWVTFNGEIYNHRALRRELPDAPFRTASDTEVLVHGWRAWGESLLPRLNGQFAFGLWDASRRELVLARDRMGQKPLYWAPLGAAGPAAGLAFASEPKALLTHPAIEPALDDESLVHYLTYEYFPGERTPYAGIRKLLPGHLLRWRAAAPHDVDIRPWWTLPGEQAPAPDDAVERFLETFDRAVERRLMSDVPLGVFLSGGIDSSAVAAALCTLRPARSVDTFAIGFDEESFDETPHARRVAEHLGTRHHEKRFRVRELRDVLPRILPLLDEPFGDPSLLPTYLLAAFTREHVTVALAGDGGDELLLGYAPFDADWAARLVRPLPHPLLAAARRTAAWLPVDARNFSPQFIIERFLRGAGHADADRHPVWIGSVLPGDADDPVRPDLRRRLPFDAVLAPAREAFAASRHPHAAQRIGHQYCLTYLPEDILYKVDRASMMRSLEVRAPFLDPELVELTARLPLRWKRRGRRSKVVLREAVAGRLPAEILRRPKKGFGIPVAAWLRAPLRELLADTLGTARLQHSPILEPKTVARLVNEHLRGRRNHAKVLWTLLVFELWRERWLG
ncbi:MAG: asparagine synthase (glutamine-hydrolyzing) [Acidobacteriota bacterium]